MYVCNNPLDSLGRRGNRTSENIPASRWAVMLKLEAFKSNVGAYVSVHRALVMALPCYVAL